MGATQSSTATASERGGGTCKWALSQRGRPRARSARPLQRTVPDVWRMVAAPWGIHRVCAACLICATNGARRDASKEGWLQGSNRASLTAHERLRGVRGVTKGLRAFLKGKVVGIWTVPC